MGEVVAFDGLTKLDIPPERVLEGAQKADLKVAVVIGWTEDDEFYFAGSPGNQAEVMWLLQVAGKWLLDNGISEKED